MEMINFDELFLRLIDIGERVNSFNLRLNLLKVLKVEGINSLMEDEL